MIKTKLWVQADGTFYLVVAMMLLLLPLQWVLAAGMAAGVHECCHFLAIRWMGGRIYGLRLGIHGIKMEMEPLTPGKELVAALAGPMGSALLVLLARWMPRLAICGFLHCFFNLLPLFSLDGGRALRGALRLFLPGARADEILSIVRRIFTWAMALISVVAAFRWGIFPAVICIVFILRLRKKRTV